MYYSKKGEVLHKIKINENVQENYTMSSYTEYCSFWYLLDGVNTKDAIKFPHICDVWKMRKNVPKNLVVTASLTSFVNSAYLIPDVVT